MDLPDDGNGPSPEVSASSAKKRLQFNPGELEIVPAARRTVWEDLAGQVQIHVPGQYRAKWSELETLRVITATPDESYEVVAADLDRSPGAVRYRRQAVIHLLRDEHGAKDRAAAYREDAKTYHKFHDYWQVDEVLNKYGFYDRSVAEQFQLAQPLLQPKSGWRGDNIGAVLHGSTRVLRDAVKRLIHEAREAEEDVGTGTDG
jgi:hypothetical protein